jgi:hypothetical protein
LRVQSRRKKDTGKSHVDLRDPPDGLQARETKHLHIEQQHMDGFASQKAEQCVTTAQQ